MFSQKFKTISKQDIANMTALATQKIKNLSQAFQDIPTIKNKVNKNNIIRETRKQFTDSATVEIGYANRKNETVLIDSYLKNRLTGYGKRYKIVDVYFVSFKLGKFKPLKGKPGQYVMNYSFVQRFSRSSKGKRNPEGLVIYDYQDETTKTGKLIIKQVTDVIGTHWKMFFDSIHVKDIKVL